MRFTFTQSSMLRGLQRVMGGVPTRMAMPSLSNLHLKLEGKTLEMASTDLEVTVTAKVKVSEADGEGSLLIQAKRFRELIGELPDVPLEIEVKEPLKVLLKGEGVGVFNLPGGDPLDFPDLPSVGAALTFKMTAETLKRIINRTMFAASHDEMRPILTGLLFQLRPGEVRVVSTDGHRLSRIVRSDANYKGDPRDVVVPVKALQILMRNLDDDEEPDLGIAESRASFTGEDHCLTTRLIDGNYPKYEGVIPESNPNTLTVRTGDMMAAVRRVAIFASQISRQVKLNLDGSTMKLESEDPELGGKGEVEVSVDYQGEPIEIAYNANYLMDVLKQIDTEEVVFELGSSNDAAVIKPTTQAENEDFLMLLMPIRLR